MRPSSLRFDMGELSTTRNLLMNAEPTAALRHGGWTFYGQVGRQSRGDGMDNADPLNVGSAFLALTARMMADPTKLFEAQV